MKTSFWVTCQSDTLITEDTLTEISASFSMKPTKIILNNLPSKRIVSQVLDDKSAQNILIFKRGLLKNLSIEQIMKKILHCDMSMDIVEGLIQCFPKPDILKKFLEKKDRLDKNLSEADEFVVTLYQIENLMPRLRSIRFKLNFDVIVKDLESELIAATHACNEIKTSKKFAKILELILMIGNFMNSGSSSVPAYGFELSFLPKLTDTKDLNNKRTFLHHLVHIIKMKFFDLLSFGNEMPHIEKVLRVKSEIIEDTMVEITDSLNELEFVLNRSKELHSSDDKFVEKMSDFAMQCKGQLETLVQLKKQLENSYKMVAEYFSFDVNQYKMEDLFSDVMSFKQSFKKAYEENVKINSEDNVKVNHYGGNSNKSIGKHTKTNIKRKNLSYPATMKTAKKICRNFSLKIENLSKEGLFSSFSLFQLYFSTFIKVHLLIFQN